jgi:hypothetical protein
VPGPLPLFDRHPGGRAPTSDGGLVALAGAAGGLLRTPPQGLAQAADVTRVVRDAKFRSKHSGNPTTSPELPSEAIGFGAALQQGGHAGELLGRQSAGSTGRRVLAESFWTTRTASLHPLADGALAHAHGRGDLTLRPALLFEVPGL